MRNDDIDTDEIDADELDGAFVPRVRVPVASIRLDGETVLMPGGEAGGAHWLDRTASVVVDLFDGHGSIDEVADALAEAYGAEPATVRADVLALARTLGRRGVLVGVVRKY